jgi:hypothetical protein
MHLTTSTMWATAKPWERCLFSKKDTPMRDLSVEGHIGSGQQQAISYKACASGVVAKARESAVVGAESSQDLWMQVCLKCVSLALLFTLLFCSLVTTVTGHVMICFSPSLPLSHYSSSSLASRHWAMMMKKKQIASVLWAR